MGNRLFFWRRQHMSDDATVTRAEILRIFGREGTEFIEKWAKGGAHFQLRYTSNLPKEYEVFAAFVTAAFVQEAMRQEFEAEKLKPHKAVRIVAVGPVVVEPRGTGGKMAIILQSGQQARVHLGGLDVDTAPTPLTGTLTPASSDTAQVGAELQTRSDGTFDAVFADNLGGNVTDPDNPVTVTVASDDPNVIPFQEAVQVVAGPATQITGDVTIEPRGTSAP
jgi:hypothetical protein